MDTILFSMLSWFCKDTTRSSSDGSCLEWSVAEHSKNSVLAECYSNLSVDGQVLWHFWLLYYRNLKFYEQREKKNISPLNFLYHPFHTVYQQLRYRLVWKGDDKGRVIHFEALFIYKTSDSYGFTKLTAIRTINREQTRSITHFPLIFFIRQSYSFM